LAGGARTRRAWRADLSHGAGEVTAG
jgi:hypothetical protein